MLTPVPFQWLWAKWVEVLPRNSSNVTIDDTRPKIDFFPLLNANGTQTSQEVEAFLALAQSGLITQLAYVALNIISLAVSSKETD